MRSTFLCAPLLSLVLAGGASSLALTSCAGSAEVVATVPAPRLVWIADGIWVVEDSAYPIYFYDGFYWRFMDGFWYRSDWYDDGFVRIRLAPDPIRRAHHPRRYTHYHAPPGVRTRRIERHPPRRPSPRARAEQRPRHQHSGDRRHR